MEQQPMPEYQPLTEAELKELQVNLFYGDQLADSQKHLAWCQNVLNNTPEADPAFARLTHEKKVVERYIELRTRYGQVGWVYDDGRKGLFMPDKDYNFSAILNGHRKDAAVATGVDLKGTRGEDE